MTRRNTPRAKKSTFVPALRFDFLSPFYDFAINAVFPDRSFKSHVIRISGIGGNEKVLDFGCGTGTLMVMIKRLHPGTSVVGVDVDGKILRIAEGKLKKSALASGVVVRYDGEHLPFKTGSFDRIVSTLVFHHLLWDRKVDTIRELKRVLRVNGRLIVGDFGRPRGVLAALLSKALSLIEPTRDNIEGRMPEMIREAGFRAIEEHESRNTIFGSLSIIAAGM